MASGHHLMLLVTNLANTKRCKETGEGLNTWHMGTYLKLLSESYPLNTNKAGFRWFLKKSLHPCALNKSSLSIGRVQPRSFTLDLTLGLNPLAAGG